MLWSHPYSLTPAVVFDYYVMNGCIHGQATENRQLMEVCAPVRKSAIKMGVTYMQSGAYKVTGGERILVALDGSVPSEQALENAISLAQKCQGKIFLIRVLEMPAEDGSAEKHSRIFEDLQESLEQIKKGVESRGLECAATVSRGSEIAARIVQEARDKDIDLVAMGTHGWTGQTAIAAMGSVARKVLCTSPCPVLIIPPKMGKDKQAECG